jgi:diacylglycerol kinase (ATP)
MKRLFIINAKAGGGRALQWWQAQRPRFEREVATGSAREWIPSSVEEIAHRLEEKLAAGFDEWVIIGGDGSWNSIANLVLANREALVGAASTLPVFRMASAGSGSDYARSLSEGEPVPADAVRLLIDGASVRYFLNMASAGLSAQVAAVKERLPDWMPRALCYAVPTLSEVWNAKPFQAELRVPGIEPLRGNTWAIFVSKGLYAGGGMRFASEVSLADGQFEISWVEKQSPLSIVLKLPSLYGAGLRSEPGVRKIRAAKAELSFSEPIAIELDGEPTRATRLGFEVVAAAKTGLRVGRF